MKIEDILHVIAGHIGADVVSLKDREFSPELLKTVSASVAKMYHCLPVAMSNGAVQVALADPLDPARADEIHFAIKRDVQIVVADPAEITKLIDRLYGQVEEGDGGANFTDILKELGADQDIAREAAEASRAAGYFAPESHGELEHLGTPPAAGRAHQHPHPRPPGGLAHIHASDAVRRIGRVARAGSHGGES